MTRERELSRGERVLPGLWRLRLPLPWPGVPHGNGWAIDAGPGVVLIDTGMHGPGSLAQLERALHQVNLRLEHVRLVACTHAHSDHWGQAATIVDRAGCALWMHPVTSSFRTQERSRSCDGPAARGGAPARRAASRAGGVRRARQGDPVRHRPVRRAGSRTR